MTPPAFTERVITTTANGAYSVFAADVDGDGDTDVLSASQFDATIDHAPYDASWGERFFHIHDADGHELSFAQLLGPAPFSS